MKSQILVVDDDSKNIFALCAVLQSRGWTCISALSAREGIELLQSNPDIGIVLMDMMMPDMDGYEAIRQIRAREGWEEMPVIAVTAQAMTGDREKCLEAGASEYLSKPVDVDLLIGIINRFLGNGSTNH
jgi:two-component system cell cycle response regulator DivK